MDPDISLESTFDILQPFLIGQNPKAGPQARLLAHNRDRRGIRQVHRGVAPQVLVISGLLLRSQVAVGSKEAQTDEQAGQDQAGDIHLGSPEWDREGSQGCGKRMCPPAFFVYLSWCSYPSPQVSQWSWRTNKA